jgi:hypothetical protein
VQENLSCPSVRNFRHKRAPEFNHRRSDSFLTGKWFETTWPRTPPKKQYFIKSLIFNSIITILSKLTWSYTCILIRVYWILNVNIIQRSCYVLIWEWTAKFYYNSIIYLNYNKTTWKITKLSFKMRIYTCMKFYNVRTTYTNDFSPESEVYNSEYSLNSVISAAQECDFSDKCIFDSYK